MGAGNYHAVALYVQLTRRFDFFRFSQHIHTDGETVQFFWLDGRKSGVVYGCADGIVEDFLGNGRLRGLQGADTAPKPPFFFDGDKDSGPVGIHFLGKLFGQTDDAARADVVFDGFPGKPDVGILLFAVF